MKEFKIRASQAHRIMGGTVGLTDKQKKRMDELSERNDKASRGEAKYLTDNMKEELISLCKIDANPELPQGAKSYCEEWLKEQLFNRRKEFANKYTEKGLTMEDNALDFVAERYGYGLLLKNEDYFEDDFMKGTPDNIQPDHSIDTKCSWDFSTFPMFETQLPTAYDWQGQVYMHLTGKKEHHVHYVLLDTPTHLIEREARNHALRNGDEFTQSIYDEFEKQMTYCDIAPELRIKTFKIEYDADRIAELIERVKLCREYINSINPLV